MNRNVGLVIGIAVLFLTVVLILNQMLPGTRRPTDYLVMGGAATMVCLLALFLILIATSMRSRDIFFRKKK
jgi:NADH:ubiquinone oxidoreductase subunit 6 (subunit J)